MLRTLMLSALLVGCAKTDNDGSDVFDTDGTPFDTDDTDDTDDTVDTDDTNPPGDCYPDGVVEPMALGEVLAPYAWPVAIQRGTGDKLDIELAQVPCASDPDIDWSPHDVLVFVSIPAW